MGGTDACMLSSTGAFFYSLAIFATYWDRGEMIHELRRRYGILHYITTSLILRANGFQHGHYHHSHARPARLCPRSRRLARRSPPRR